MSSPTGKRDVIRLRTFAEDLEYARTQKGISEEQVKNFLPQEAETVESKGILKKIKKKSLDLHEQTAGTEIDSDGVSFDEEVALKVVEQSYEVSKSIVDEAAAKVSDVVIPTESVQIVERDTVKSAADFLGMTANEKSPVTAVPPVILTRQTTNAPAAPKITLSTAPEYADIAAMPTSVLGDEQAQVHELTSSDIGRGEIVSDKKRDRFKLLPAIGTAMSDWVGSTKERIGEAQREKHTVAKTDQRIETIKAAAQSRTLAPGTDFDQVAEHLRKTTKNTTNDAPVVLKPKQETVSSWTHTVPEPATREKGAEVIIDSLETEAPTLETLADTVPEVPPVESATEVTPVAVSDLPPTPAVTTPSWGQPTTPEPVVREIRNAAFSLADLEQITETQAVQEPVVQRGELAAAAHQQIAEQEATQLATARVTGKTFTMPSVALPTMRSGREFLPSPTIAIVVVMLAIVSGIGTSVYFFWQPGEGSAVPAATTNPLFTAQLQADVILDQSHATTMSTLLSAVNSTPGSLYLYLTLDGGQTVVPPHDVMNFLAPQAPGAFTRSVTNVSFGSLDNRPFIILRVNNFDNAFSGMLAWEQTMSSDLAPLFGPAVAESLDAQARTSSQTRGAFFKDVVANNLSSRVLVNERGEDRILYTFLDRQTVVITTDRLQLTNILPLIR